MSNVIVVKEGIVKNDTFGRLKIMIFNKTDNSIKITL
jgi:dUTPase